MHENIRSVISDEKKTFKTRKKAIGTDKIRTLIILYAITFYLIFRQRWIAFDMYRIY
jgi:hypothetical protein